MNALVISMILSGSSSTTVDIPQGIVQGGRVYHAGGSTPLPPSSGTASYLPGSTVIPSKMAPSSIPARGSLLPTSSLPQPGTLMPSRGRPQAIIRPANRGLIPGRVP